MQTDTVLRGSIRSESWSKNAQAFYCVTLCNLNETGECKTKQEFKGTKSILVHVPIE